MPQIANKTIFKLFAVFMAVLIISVGFCFPIIKTQAVAVVDDVVIGVAIVVAVCATMGITFSSLGDGSIVQGVENVFNQYLAQSQSQFKTLGAVIGAYGYYKTLGSLMIKGEFYNLIANFVNYFKASHTVLNTPVNIGNGVVVNGETFSIQSYQIESFSDLFADIDGVFETNSIQSTVVSYSLNYQSTGVFLDDYELKTKSSPYHQYMADFEFFDNNVGYLDYSLSYNSFYKSDGTQYSQSYMDYKGPDRLLDTALLATEIDGVVTYRIFHKFEFLNDSQKPFIAYANHFFSESAFNSLFTAFPTDTVTPINDTIAEPIGENDERYISPPATTYNPYDSSKNIANKILQQTGVSDLTQVAELDIPVNTNPPENSEDSDPNEKIKDFVPLGAYLLAQLRDKIDDFRNQMHDDVSKIIDYIEPFKNIVHSVWDILPVIVQYLVVFAVAFVVIRKVVGR